MTSPTPPWRPDHRRRSRKRPAALLAGLLVAGCMSCATVPGAPPLSGPTPPVVDTSGEFYADPPVAGTADRPGQLIRYQAVGPRTFRVMYWSQVVLTSNGTATVATVPTSATAVAPSEPVSDRPAAGWPLIVWGHGTTGMLPECGPSRDPSTAFFHPWLIQPGAWSVAPDYIGLGVDSGLRSPDATVHVDGPSMWPATARPLDRTSHPYLSPSGAGRAVLDAIRATRSLETVLSPQIESDPGRAALVIGLSQGGHAAIAAGEEHAAGYAPEVELRAIVAAAPPVDVDLAELSPTNRARLLPRLLGPMSIQHRDLSPTTLLDPAGRDRYALTWDDTCSTTWPFLLADALLPVDPVTDDELAALVQQPGVAAALGDLRLGDRALRVPVLVAHVESDPTVPVAGSLRYAARARAAGTAVTLCTYSGLTASPTPLDHLAGLALLWAGAPGSCTGPDGRAVPSVNIAEFVAPHTDVVPPTADATWSTP